MARNVDGISIYIAFPEEHTSEATAVIKAGEYVSPVGEWFVEGRNAFLPIKNIEEGSKYLSEHFQSDIIIETREAGQIKYQAIFDTNGFYDALEKLLEILLQ